VNLSQNINAAEESAACANDDQFRKMGVKIFGNEKRKTRFQIFSG
jgi:protein-disulfide isomerase